MRIKHSNHCCGARQLSHNRAECAEQALLKIQEFTVQQHDDRAKAEEKMKWSK